MRDEGVSIFFMERIALSCWQGLSWLRRSLSLVKPSPFTSSKLIQEDNKSSTTKCLLTSTFSRDDWVQFFSPVIYPVVMAWEVALSVGSSIAVLLILVMVIGVCVHSLCRVSTSISYLINNILHTKFNFCASTETTSRQSRPLIACWIIQEWINHKTSNH